MEESGPAIKLAQGLSTVATLAAARSHWEIFVQSEMGPCEFAKHVTPKQRGWSALMNIIKMLEELRAERQMIEEINPGSGTPRHGSRPTAGPPAEVDERPINSASRAPSWLQEQNTR